MIDCFTWNGVKWEGKRPTNPISTQCGLKACARCGKFEIPYRITLLMITINR